MATEAPVQAHARANESEAFPYCLDHCHYITTVTEDTTVTEEGTTSCNASVNTTNCTNNDDAGQVLLSFLDEQLQEQAMENYRILQHRAELEERLRQNEEETLRIQLRQAEIIRKQQEEAAANYRPPPVNYDEMRRAIQDQMSHVRSLFEKTCQSQSEEQQSAVSDAGTDLTDVSKSDVQLPPSESLGITRPSSTRGRGFRQLMFGRGGLKLKPSSKKQYVDQLDDEIAFMRKELKRMTVISPDDDEEEEDDTDGDTSSRNDETPNKKKKNKKKKGKTERRRRSKSPSWAMVSFNRAKSPATKKARNKSPARTCVAV